MKVTATIKEACEMSGLGKTTIYNRIAQGDLATVAIGRRRLVRIDSLLRLLEAA